MIFRVVGLNAGGVCRVDVDQLNGFLEEEKFIKTVTFIPFFKHGDEISDANVTKYCYVNKWRLVKFISSLVLKTSAQSRNRQNQLLENKASRHSMAISPCDPLQQNSYQNDDHR